MSRSRLHSSPIRHQVPVPVLEVALVLVLVLEQVSTLRPTQHTSLSL